MRITTNTPLQRTVGIGNQLINRLSRGLPSLSCSVRLTPILIEDNFTQLPCDRHQLINLLIRRVERINGTDEPRFRAMHCDTEACSIVFIMWIYYYDYDTTHLFCYIYISYISNILKTYYRIDFIPFFLQHAAP
ncbi:hypothetical protein GJV44_00637 [Candidatus Vallotia cooleyia]|nr:hypothetical protein GJV44_00637 [Candidatus Vallotia cooleyia]